MENLPDDCENPRVDITFDAGEMACSLCRRKEFKIGYGMKFILLQNTLRWLLKETCSVR